jgi:hypothetical protein
MVLARVRRQAWTGAGESSRTGLRPSRSRLRPRPWGGAAEARGTSGRSPSFPEEPRARPLASYTRAGSAPPHVNL